MSTEIAETLAVIDTDAFSHVFVERSSPQHRDLRDRLAGRILVIATQTRAELLAWPAPRNWGADRASQLAELLDATRTVPVTDEIVAA